MTRKQAIQRAIEALQQTNDTEAIAKLQELSTELPLIHWSDSSIRDAVEQFILDYGRQPTATDFKKAGMPPHPVIQNRYKVSVKQWLEENYPTPRPTFEELKETYTQAFLEDYDRIKPRSQYEFNEQKRPETRGWQTVASYHNVKSWRQLLKTLDLPLYFDMKRDHVPPKLTVIIQHDYDFKD